MNEIGLTPNAEFIQMQVGEDDSAANEGSVSTLAVMAVS